MQSAQTHPPPQGAAPPQPPAPLQPASSGSVNTTNNMSSQGQVAAANMQHTQYQPQQYQQHQQQHGQQHQHTQNQQPPQQQPPPQQHHQQPPPPQHHHQPPPPQHHQQQHPPPPQQHHHQQQHHQQPPPPQHHQQPPPQHHQQPPPPQHQHQQHHQHHQQHPPPPPPQHHQHHQPHHQHQQQQPVQRNSYSQPHAPQGQPQQQPPQQQQQHHYQPHQGLNGGWQSDKDYQERRKMIAKIVHLLQQRKPNAPQEWLKKLPQMAKRLEESLYRSAKSFQEYNDASTLKHRLQQLAVNIGMKTKKMQQAQMAKQQMQPQPHAPVQQQPHHYRPPQQPQAVHPAPGPQPVQARPPSAPQQMQHQQPMQQPPQAAPPPPPQQPQQQRIVNVAEINPIMSGSSQPQTMVNSVPAPAPPAHQYAPQPAPAPQPPPQSAPPAPGNPPAPGQNGARPVAGRQVSDRQQVLRHQQQRLLLLRHAAKCQHDDGRCPVTPHCAGMKRLWKHIAECKDQKCLVPHCVSSRYVLSHYHRCKDVRCPVCGPVREAIHRSHEKQKQMQALKQRHQQAVQQNQVPTAPTAGAPAPVAPASLAPPMAAPPVPPVVAPPSHSIVAPVGSAEPPNKRQKTAAIPAPGQPYQPMQPAPPQPVAPQPHAAQPSTAMSAIPTQPPAVGPSSQYQYAPQPGAPVQSQQKVAVAPVPVPGATPGQVQSGAAPPRITTAPGIAFANGQVITPKYTGPKPQEDHTLINCFSVAQIETHIASLNKGLQLPPQKLKAKCLDVLKVLQSHQHGWVFNSPVDPVELGLPDYFEVIKKPMDLGTIRKRLENGCYHSLEEFESHVHLTFDNAMLYNPQGSVVYNMAEEMKAKFVQDYQNLMKQLNAEEDVKRRNGEACLLCGCEKLLFEPPVFYCNGMNCPSKRIRRNSYYYVGGNNQYHWCHQCYQELKDNQTIELADITVKKEALVKKKNDEVHEESWVQCDRCERWIHQICALFNTRQNKDQRSEYACPRCTIEERKKKGQFDAISTTPMAEDLPRTLLSEYLEDNVRKKVDEYVDKHSKEKAEAEQIPIEEARKAIQMGGHITIRQVTSMDRKLEVRERMKRRYAFKNYPDEFSFRCKCIVVFQNLDGVDVILFGLYVYEHDETNPEPNKRTVYVSYLDSVHYMRPRKMRTFIYHEILVSYLDYVRKRGFCSAHIWACPPLKGDDYILYAKPEDQKVPKDDRLRQWYIDMLVECQKRGVVGKVTNMYDLYFSNPKNDATIVPYMDGDYFPAEVENIIKDIEEGKTGKKGNSQGKKKKGSNKSKQKKKSGRGGTRSAGLDEEALKASGFVPPGMEGKSIEEGGRDYVMVKLGDTIQPMKESFIVAFLAWEGATAENMVVPKEIENYRKEHGIVVTAGKQKPEDDKPESMETEPIEAKGKKDDQANPVESNDSKSEGAKVKEEGSNGVTKPDEKGGENAAAAEPEKNGATTVKDEPMPDANSEKADAKPEGKSEAEVKDGAKADEKSCEEKKPEEKSEAETKDGAKEETEKKDEAKQDEKDAKESSDSAEPKEAEKKDASAEAKDSSQQSGQEASSQQGSQETAPDSCKAQATAADSSSAQAPTADSKAPATDDSAAESSAAPPAPADSTAASTASGSNDTAPAPNVSNAPAPATDSANPSLPSGASAPANVAAPAPLQADEGSTALEAETTSAPAPSSGPTPMDTDQRNSAPAEAPQVKEEPSAPNAEAPKADSTSAGAPSPTPPQQAVSQQAMAIRKGKFAAMAKTKKRDVEGNEKEAEKNPEDKEKDKERDKVKAKEKKVSKAIYVKDSKGRTVKVIDDDDEEMDCEFLNNRQAFLNLCQGNHYQFDQLRRAKHSSMMVLWHLHNRDAPKFVQQCATCSREILTGFRYHCPTCADFDQCQECVQNPKVARHPHQLKPIPVASGQQPELTEEQRKERQRSIQLHMTLLQHAATCTSPKCPSANCTKMKGLLKHGSQCQIKATGGCNVCKRIWALLQIHARQCKADSCPVPNCMAIRERVRQLKKQQQAMDDRRRQEMNRAYHVRS